MTESYVFDRFCMFSPTVLACSTHAIRVSCILLRHGHYVVCFMVATRLFMSAVTSVGFQTQSAKFNVVTAVTLIIHVVWRMVPGVSTDHSAFSLVGDAVQVFGF